MPTDRKSYNIKYGAATQFGKTNSALHQGEGGGFDMSQITSMIGGSKKGDDKPKGEPVYNYRTGETSVIQFKSPSAFKLRSGNTSAFKMLGSSPTKIFGSVFGWGGGGMSWVQKQMEKFKAKREARRNKRLGLTPPDGGGGDGAHTHGTGGEAIGGAQAAAVSPSPEGTMIPPADEEVVA